MKKSLLFALAVCLCALATQAQKRLELPSPDGGTVLSVEVSDRVRYSVLRGGVPVLRDGAISMTLAGGTLGENPKLLRHKTGSADEAIRPVVPLKFSEVRNRYNSLRMDFKGGWALEMRAYDDGIAYRFVTALSDTVEVLGEDFSVALPDGATLHLQQPGGFKTSYEDTYTHVAAGEWKSADRFSTLPVLASLSGGLKVLFSEADLEGYPCMFLSGTGNGGVRGLFPKVPLEFGPDGDRSVKILREADYIARTAGTRAFPWRFAVIGTDAQIVSNTMTCRLARPSAIADVSWIRPGQVSWEWWNGASPYGPDVDFVAGFNKETYKYYIDFAARYGIPYILMDEGWAKSTLDPYTPNPTVDVHELIAYGKERGVGVMLWLTWLTVDRHPELFERFASWGVKGVKVDFMDRSDQWMVDYYRRVARAAADNRLLVDFHGSFKPVGLEHEYPNVISFEGVRGMEQMGGCTPDNSLWFPFIRNAVGAMDYTPGAMISMQPESYRSERPNSASIGTRAYQIALYVVFESGLQMLADNPTLYYRGDDCTRFIASVPTTWDETRVLHASAGEYIVVAKRKGEKWFLGAITNGGEARRTFELPLDFLPAGARRTMTVFSDGVNAGRQAMDYRRDTRQVDGSSRLTVELARNGGWVASIE